MDDSPGSIGFGAAPPHSRYGVRRIPSHIRKVVAWYGQQHQDNRFALVLLAFLAMEVVLVSIALQ